MDSSSRVQAQVRAALNNKDPGRGGDVEIILPGKAPSYVHVVGLLAALQNSASGANPLHEIMVRGGS
jgi:hypothetical protein